MGSDASGPLMIGMDPPPNTVSTGCTDVEREAVVVRLATVSEAGAGEGNNNKKRKTTPKLVMRHPFPPQAETTQFTKVCPLVVKVQPINKAANAAATSNGSKLASLARESGALTRLEATW
jgi:hypothetical protein